MLVPIDEEEAVRIMLSHPSFSSIFPIYCKTSCPRHNIKLHNYASRLLQQHVARAYGQDTVRVMPANSLASLEV